MKKALVKSISLMILVFMLTSSLLAAILLCSAEIPRTAIEKQVHASAEFLCKRKLFFEIIPGISGSKIDRFADTVLLGIAWQYEADDPLHSVAASSYYHEFNVPENEGLLKAVTEHLPANQEYLRYWHGSIAIIRPLLVLMPLQGIYILNALTLAFLTVCLFIRLWRRRAGIPLLGLIIALSGTAFWFVPLSLEYTWVFLILMVQLHLILCRSFPCNLTGRLIFFLVSGIVTNYLDFLTTELLTLFIPLLLILWLDQEEGIRQPSFLEFFALTVSWGAGYAGMWGLKWLFAGAVLGTEFREYVGFHIWIRSTAVIADSAAQQRREAVFRNLKCIFPAEYGNPGFIACAGAGMGALYTGYVYHRPSRLIKTKYLFIAVLAGLAPVLRFIALSNHSYIHYFFTYRVLAVTLFAIVLILGEIISR